MSDTELNRLTRRYMQNIAHIIGINRDIPAPDMGTTARTMAWMMDSYGQMHGHTPGIVTGKPVELGGSLGREAATGRGVFTVLEQLCAELGCEPAEMPVAVQGYGNVGSWSARLAYEAGHPVVAVSDVSGGIYDANGLDLDALETVRAEGGRIADFAGADTITNEELLALPCRALIPAATGDVITERNVADIKAEIVIEAANHPTSLEADEALEERGVQVVPDILANAGGVTVSYFEWTQNIQQFRWDEARVNGELERILVQAYREVRALAEEHNTTMRRAAYRIAVRRVADAIKLRGFV
jgi:glutamate dehydrogenase (NAD(P)+)